MPLGSKYLGRSDVVKLITEHPDFRRRGGKIPAPVMRTGMKLFGSPYMSFVGWPDIYMRSRWPKFLKMLEPEASDRILDIGCGPGMMSLELGDYGCDVTGVDIDEADVVFANSVAGANDMHNTRFYRMSGTDLKFPDSYFTKVVASGYLEHVEDGSQALGELYRVLTQGGVLVGNIPLASGHHHSEKGRHGPEPDRNKPGHFCLRDYSRDELGEMLGAAGFVVEEYAPDMALGTRIARRVARKAGNPYIGFPMGYWLTAIDRFSRNPKGIIFRARKPLYGNTNDVDYGTQFDIF